MRSGDLNNSHSIGEIRGELGAAFGKHNPSSALGHSRLSDVRDGSAVAPKAADFTTTRRTIRDAAN